MIYDIPAHPTISNMERTGYPDGREPECPICPVCGEECETIYINIHSDAVGCDECIKTRDAWGIDECFPWRD